MTKSWNNHIKIPYGAWYEDTELCLSVPESWKVQILAPVNGPEISDQEIETAIENPVGTPLLNQLARGKRSAVIVVDDITRPTPAARILPSILKELSAGGLRDSDILILIGSGAHRPMTQSEIIKKLGEEIASKFTVKVHDFLGKDIRYVGMVQGGPVYLNGDYLDADVRICLGCVIGNNNAGFGGGAKMVIPGIAGHTTIAHFHGALPDRSPGQLEGNPEIPDKRMWAEQVAQWVGIDLVVCAVLNSKRQLAGLYAGDVIKAHRLAAKFALKIGETIVPKETMQNSDIIIVNSYPLDNAPTQMIKPLGIAKQLSTKFTVAIGAASDGIFYHGMGWGQGIHLKRFIKHIGRWLTRPDQIWSWIASVKAAGTSPSRLLGLFLITFNYMSFDEYQRTDHTHTGPIRNDEANSNFLLYSTHFPDWAFEGWMFRKRNDVVLYRDWEEIITFLSRKFQESPTVLVIPCAPLQFITSS